MQKPHKLVFEWKSKKKIVVCSEDWALRRMNDCCLSTLVKTLKFSLWDALVMQPSCWWFLICGRKKLQFWAWKLKQLEALQEKLTWRVACSGYSVINSLSAPGLSRKTALELLPCCPLWYRNKWQMLCCQLRLGASLWFFRSPAQHLGTLLEIRYNGAFGSISVCSVTSGLLFG